LAAARADIRYGVGSNVEAVVVADARDLKAWADSSFDAVLSLGPFYHLPQLHDREAVRQKWRACCDRAVLRSLR
jgi:hypothetical protein